jgi:hypothetical protein
MDVAKGFTGRLYRRLSKGCYTERNGERKDKSKSGRKSDLRGG